MKTNQKEQNKQCDHRGILFMIKERYKQSCDESNIEHRAGEERGVMAFSLGNKGP